MDPQPDLIRQQIDQTRSSLTDKLETLEAEVKETVQSARDTMETAREAVEETFASARETVQDTISSVKESVHSATATVKRTFDVEHQVQEHPWAMLGLSLVSGVAVGVLLGGRLDPGRRVARRMSEASAEPYGRAESTPVAPASRPTHEDSGRPGFVDKLTSQLGDEFEKVKDLAIAALVGVVADTAKRAIPAMTSAVEDMMARAAADFGAPPQQYGENRRQPVAGAGYQTPPMY
jgi:ElaB/YqjD/DUF883 family membrane-anchored ribosome-binding protein